MKNISISFIIVIIISGILIDIIAFLNISELSQFYRNCPYNFAYNDIAKIFNIDYNKNKGKNINDIYSKKCSDRRCLFIREYLDNLTYFCNFDSSNDFPSYYNNTNNKTSYSTNDYNQTFIDFNYRNETK